MSQIVDWFSVPFEQEFMRRALLEIALLAIVSGVVGTFVVLKGIAFIVDALSHAILPGIALAYLFGFSLLTGALVAGVVVALAISGVAHTGQVSEDSAIGIFFTGAFSLGVILISKTVSRSLSDILFGQIFGVSEGDLWTTFLIGGGMVVAVLALRKELLLSAFDSQQARAMGLPVDGLNLLLYVLVALTVVISLPAVGNILVLSLLITPAATARLLTDRFYRVMGLAIGCALLTGAGGLYLSYHAGWAGGASIVMLSTLLFLVVLALSPRYGLVSYWRSRFYRRQPITPNPSESGN